MNRVTPETLATIEAQYASWAEFLNGGIGLAAFAFGISCLGTPRPDITGFLSLAFLLIVMLHGQKRFPAKLQELRKEELSGIDEVAYLGIKKKFFGLAAVVKNFSIYLIGWFFLGAVALYGVAVHAY